MHKGTMKNKHSHHEDDYDFYGDLAKIKEALTDASQHAKTKAEQYVAGSFDHLKEKSTDMQDDIANYVAKKPIKSLGIAVVTGLLIGYLLRK